MNTQITCPRCAGACFAATLDASRSTFEDNNVPLPGMKYMLLTCQRCNEQLMFVVDLLPQFEDIVDTLHDTNTAKNGGYC